TARQPGGLRRAADRLLRLQRTARLRRKGRNRVRQRDPRDPVDRNGGTRAEPVAVPDGQAAARRRALDRARTSRRSGALGRDQGRSATPSALSGAAPGQGRARRYARASGMRGVSRMQMSNPDKVLFPDDGITKADLADYYLRMADAMLPWLRDRPIAMVRRAA